MEKRILKWWNSRSATFSWLCDEEFTHGQVVLVHLAVVMLIVVCGLAGA